MTEREEALKDKMAELAEKTFSSASPEVLAICRAWHGDTFGKTGWGSAVFVVVEIGKAEQAVNALRSAQSPHQVRPESAGEAVATVISEGMDHRAMIDRHQKCPVGTKLYASPQPSSYPQPSNLSERLADETLATHPQPSSAKEGE